MSDLSEDRTFRFRLRMPDERSYWVEVKAPTIEAARSKAAAVYLFPPKGTVLIEVGQVQEKKTRRKG